MPKVEFKTVTREAWLIAAMGLLDEEFFKGKGYKLPEKLGVSCGIPKGKSTAIGQCWDPTVAADGTTHMFICPSIDQPIRVLDILLHEMIHALVGIEQKHNKVFRKYVKEFGLAGKATATYAEEGSELWVTLSKIREQLGNYPHSAMSKIRKKVTVKSKWVRYVSTTEPKYKVVINEDRVEEFGVPIDPWGDEMELVKKDGE